MVAASLHAHLDPVQLAHLRVLRIETLRKGRLPAVAAEVLVFGGAETFKATMVDLLGSALTTREAELLELLLAGKVSLALSGGLGLRALRLLPGQSWHDSAREVLTARAERRENRRVIRPSIPTLGACYALVGDGAAPDDRFEILAVEPEIRIRFEDGEIITVLPRDWSRCHAAVCATVERIPLYMCKPTRAPAQLTTGAAA